MSTVTLCCCCYGDSPPSNSAFLIQIPEDETIQNLRTAIAASRGNWLRRKQLDVADLLLYAPRMTIPLEEADYTISTLNLDTSGERLMLWKRIKDYKVLLRSQEDHLSILVHIDEDVSLPRPPKTHLSPPLQSHIISRQDTVVALYEQAKDCHFVLVRGTPGSGKTVLCNLLSRHILKVEQHPRVQYLDWTQRNSDEPSLHRKFDAMRRDTSFTYDDMMQQHQQIFWVLLDEAQQTYNDEKLWSTLFKGVAQGSEFQNFRVVAFASYGTQLPAPAPYSRTLFQIVSSQSMGLRPIDGVTQGLLFTREEFIEYLRLKYDINSNTYQTQGNARLSSDLEDHIYELSQGHIGAINFLLDLVQTTAARCPLAPGELFSLGKFLDNLRLPMENLGALLSSRNSQAFGRGLPGIAKVRAKLPLCDLFRRLVRERYVVLRSEDDPCFEEARLAYHHGWLTIEENWDPGVCGWVVEFASPLHRLWFSWISGRERALPSDFQYDRLVDMAIAVISGFSARHLEMTHRTPVSRSGVTFAEAHFHLEFYRSLDILSNGAILASPEFSTPSSQKPGRIDFYIPERKWGVEILRDGSMLVEHHDRFKTGAYHPWLKDGTMSDFIILDFRKSEPHTTHEDLKSLYHVVFTKDYRQFTVYDNRLIVVHPATALAS